MAEDIRIRPASAADIAALVDLVREYWAFEGIEGFDSSRTTTALHAFFANPSHGGAWVAERQATTSEELDHERRPASEPRKGAAAVGYLVVCHVFSIEHGGLTAEIDEFFLLAPYRGGGLGRRLLETAEVSFLSARLTNVAFEIGRGNEAARGFYRRLGYSDRGGYDRMEKNLPAHPASKTHLG